MRQWIKRGVLAGLLLGATVAFSSVAQAACEQIGPETVRCTTCGEIECCDSYHPLGDPETVLMTYCYPA
jgi:hypothetical protein